MSKRNKIIIGIIAIWVFFGIIGAMNKPEETTQANNQEQTEQKEEKPQTTMDKLWVAVDDFSDRDGKDVSFDEKTGTAKYTHYEETFFNNKSIVTNGYQAFVNWGNDIKDIPEVKTIEVAIQTDFTDQKGNESREDAVFISMDVDKFKEYNWSNLSGQPIHTQLRQDGILIFMPSIIRDVNLNDTRLVYTD